MNLNSKFCYCYITWTCICIIHLSEGALLLYYMYILYFTPTWRYLAIVLLYCIGLYTYLRGSWYCTIHLSGGGLPLYNIVLYTYALSTIEVLCTIHLLEGTWLLYYIVLYTYLREPCYCTILYYTPTWGSLAIVVHGTIHLPEGALLS